MRQKIIITIILIVLSPTASAMSLKLGYAVDWISSQFSEDSDSNLSVPGIAESHQVSEEDYLVHSLLFGQEHTLYQAPSFMLAGQIASQWYFAGSYNYTVGSKTGSADIDGGLGLSYSVQLYWRTTEKLTLGLDSGLVYQRIGGAASSASIFPYKSYMQAFTMQALSPRFGLVAQYQLPEPFVVELKWNLAWTALWHETDYSILSAAAEAGHFSNQHLGLGLVYQY